MTDKFNNGYISLQEASQRCSHSQEYLSLRARQGKLKAVKFGRNWVTKKEWLEEYLQNIEEYNNRLTEKKLEEAKTEKVENWAASWLANSLRVIKGIKGVMGKIPKPTSSAGMAVAKGDLAIGEIKGLEQKPAFAVLVGLVFVLLVGGIIFGKESFWQSFEDVSPIVQKVSQDVDKYLLTQLKSIPTPLPPSPLGRGDLTRALSSSPEGRGDLLSRGAGYTYIISGAGETLWQDVEQSFVNVAE